MPGDSQEIGGVHFTVGVEGAEGAKAEIAGVGQATEQTGQKMAAAGTAAETKLAGGVRESVKEFKGLKAAAMGAIGALGSVAALYQSITAAVEKLREARVLSAKDADIAHDAENLRMGAKARAEAIMAQIEAESGTLEALRSRSGNFLRTGGLLRFLDDRSIKGATERIGTLRQQLMQANAQAEAEERRIAADKARTAEDATGQVESYIQSQLQAKLIEEQRLIIYQQMVEEQTRLGDLETARIERLIKQQVEMRKLADETRAYFDDFRRQQSTLFNGSDTAFALREMVDLLERLSAKTEVRY